MTPAALILRGMLAVACPGVSQASRIELLACGPECRATTAALTGHRPERDFKWIRARWPGWSRQETEVEGLQRWAGIADGVARVVADPPPAWKWPHDELWRVLVTIARHESAFWRSIQEGRLRGPDGEWGLFQCYPTLPGCDSSLVGLDVDAVERAARFAADHLARARAETERRSCDNGWLPATLVLYATGHRCAGEFPTLDRRVATFDKLAADPDPLPFGALLALAEVR